MQIDSVMVSWEIFEFSSRGDFFIVQSILPWGKEDVSSVRGVTVCFYGSPIQGKCRILGMGGEFLV